MLSVKILVSGKRPDGQKFSEEGVTSVVNTHGALIFLAERVTIGQSVTVRNLKSSEELHAEVVDIGSAHEGKRQVGIDFREAAPRFWRIAFPPEDWSPRNPEAKRRTISSQVAPINQASQNDPRQRT